MANHWHGADAVLLNYCDDTPDVYVLFQLLGPETSLSVLNSDERVCQQQPQRDNGMKNI